MGHQTEVKKIVIVSDATGGTANRLVNAILVQYQAAGIKYSIVGVYREVRTVEQVKSVLSKIRPNYLIIYTIVTKELRDFFHERLKRRNIFHLDVLAPMMKTMSKFLGVHPHYEPGLLKVIDASYFHEIDAIDFAKQHDDGCGERLGEAELVLVGPSRSGKTPLSMYLACNEGIWVANIPIIPDEGHKRQLLALLKGIDPARIIATIINPAELSNIRGRRRIINAGESQAHIDLSSYHDLHTVQLELIFCRRLYEAQGWTVVDVTRRAIEDIAEEVLKSINYTHPE